ncbi:hypothetical protein R4K54_06080 [Brachyspira murdochii]|uniref:alginate O-acetyltransferase AlgX-related protein n=1 Tax=Brachyspira murdochii TaxID=84378 RepID=UPI003007B540
MKNESLFNKISLLISIVIMLLILISAIFGSFNRIGYLSELKLISSENNIYSYHFRIKYYSKVFRNSDIYNVYFDTDKITKANNYIIKITVDANGSPFGMLESNINIDSDIDNVVYTLKLKKSIIILSLILVMILLLHSIILDSFKRLLKINLKNRYTYILIIFLCFLIMPNIIYKIFYDKFDHNNYELRKLSIKPTFNFKEINKYPSLYENYFNDYVPFRNEFTQIKNMMDIYLFKNLVDDLILLGKDNWLFFRNFDNLIYKYMGVDLFSEKELEIAKNNLINFRNELNKKNIDFILMICPDKQLIYDQYMPFYIKRKHIDDIDQFVNYMRDNSDIKIVYPKSELIKYKNYYPLYYKYDHHWNYLGGYIGYTELLKELGLDYIKIDDSTIIETKEPPFYKDLATFISLYKYLNSDEKLYTILGYNNYYIVNGKNEYNQYLFCKSYSNYNKKKIFFVRDSFSQVMVNYIASTFEESSFIHIDNFKNDGIIYEESDILVFEFVGRHLEYRVLDTINKYLSTN